MRYLLIFLLLQPFYCFCQHTVVSATKFNILYIGIDNPISFAVENVKCSELSIAVENGSAKKTGECEYDVAVTKPGRVTIFIIKGHDTISRTPYRAKDIPNPIITEGRGGPDSYILLDSVRAWRKLSLATINNFDFDPSFSIVSFDIIILKKYQRSKKKIYCDECYNKIKYTYYTTVFLGKNEGVYFNEELVDFFKNRLMPGDRIIIESIKALGPDNTIRSLNTIIANVQ